MLQNRSFIFLFFIVFFLPSLQGRAGEFVSVDEQVVSWDEGKVNYRPPAYDQIEKWKNNPSFLYDRENKPVEFWNWLWNYILGWLASLTQSGNWLVVALSLLSIGLLFLLLIRIFNVPVSGLFFLSRNREVSDLQFVEGPHGVSVQKLEEMLKLYRSNQAYRESVRVLFLLYLQDLQAQGLILLKTFKTNHEYLREITNEEQRALFRKRMGLFDYVWYGQAPVSREIYLKVEQAFGYPNGKESVL